MKKIHIDDDPELKNTGGKKYSMFVGKFQPFHVGHKWIVDKKLDQGKNVLICIRDIVPDENNPLLASEVKNNIMKELWKLIGQERVKVIVIPDIESVNFEKGVDYDIIEHIPSQEIRDTFATKIREQLKQEGKL